MKRKHEDSPSRSCERSKKISPFSKNLRLFEKPKTSSLKKVLFNSSKKPSSAMGIGLRRSSRKATIERRVWAEPRREKNWKLTKDCSSDVVSKRGRPPKKVRASNIVLKNSGGESSINKKYKNDLQSFEDNDGPVLIDNVQNGTHLSDNEVALVIDDDNKEGTLIIDDDVASLQGAVVDEVIQDYPHKISNSILDSQFKPNNLSDLSQHSFISQSISKIKLEVNNISSVSNETTRENDLYINSREPVSHNTEISDVLSGMIEVKCTDEDKEIIGDEKKMLIIEDNNDEDNDDDNHVSLSEALAKLVESEEPGLNNELETVTIHPVTFSEETKSLYSSLTALNNIPVHCVATSFPSSTETPVSNDFSSKETNLICSSNESERVICPSNESGLVLKPTQSSFSSQCKEESERLCCDENESANPDPLPSKEETHSVKQISGVPSTKQPVPPLVKIATKPLVIRTPLKCCECSMRFCTVRSLFWHFGTHEPIRNGRENSEIVLENLIASWDRPDVPIQLPNKTERDSSKVDKVSSCKEFSCNSFTSVYDSKTRCEKYDKSFPNGNGVSRDFILKVPIPRLKRYAFSNSENNNSSVDSKCTTIPCTTTPDITISPTPSISILPRSSYVPPVSTPEATFSITLTPCPAKSVQDDAHSTLHSSVASQSPISVHSVPSCSSPCKDITPQVKSYSSTITSTSTTLTISTKPGMSEFKPSNKSTKSQVTVIPVEKLSQLRNRIRNGISGSDIFEVEEPKDKTEPPSSESFLEENGLVVINRSLALRIVNTSTTDKQSLEATNSMGETSCLTILPQSKNDSLGSNGRHRNSSPTPDILTIVPQIDPLKQMRKWSQTPSPPQLMTAIGKVTPDSSQVVKLILVPPKEEVPLTEDSNKQTYGRSMEEEEEDWDLSDDSSDVESDEGGMVIDVKEEEGATMDPLSMCTVTMDDDDIEIKPHTFDQTKELHDFDATFHKEDSLTSLSVSEVISPSNEMGNKRTVPVLDEEKYLKRKYVCEFCQKRFGWSTDLKRHVILHTGERPFKCKWCPITFTRKFLLQNHMKKIHSQLCKWSDLWE